MTNWTVPNNTCILGGQYAPCYEERPENRGIAVYRENEKVCLSRLLLPGFNLLPRPLLGAVYLAFLLYLFVGIVHVAHHFMGGIEHITSVMKKVKKKNERGEVYYVEKPVWNWAVANISLMALGTSGPEVTLAFIEALLTLGKKTGELGPSCIVGSAAYNLMMITAVSMTAVPGGQHKKIEAYRVFLLTASWSIWAYVWMLIVYRWWTPEEITIVEAALTLTWFVLLLISAWFVDTQPYKEWGWYKKWRRNAIGSVPPTEADLSMLKLPYEPPPRTPLPDGTIPDVEDGQPGSGSPPRTAWEEPMSAAMLKRMKVAGTASEMGDDDEQTVKNRNFINRNLLHRHYAGLRRFHLWGPNIPMQVNPDGTVRVSPSDKEVVMFKSAAYAFKKDAGVARVAVTRVPPVGGSLNTPLKVHWRTEDGDALAGQEYLAAEGSLTFAPDEETQYIEIQLLDKSSDSEPDVYFHIKLHKLESPAGLRAALAMDRVRITLSDDDDVPGMIGFELPTYQVTFEEGRPYAEIVAVRRRGCSGRVEVGFSTQDDTAIGGVDYVPAAGTLVFEPGQKHSHLRIPLLVGDGAPGSKELVVTLQNPDGGAGLSSRHTTHIIVTKGIAPPRQNQDYNINEAWWAQIKESYQFEPPANGEPVRWWHLLEHFLSLPWRVWLCLTCAPPEWAGGYPCFWAALINIIAIVYCVNEAGQLFGCIVGLKDVMTGLTLLAMGTSLPDTFASRIAALTQPNADQAIGNITASNSVNVFVGLGLPWIICSCYYKAKGERYITPSGDLAWAVFLYAFVATIGFTTITINRFFGGGELGGSKKRQWTLFAILFVVWMAYLILSGMRAYNNIDSVF